MPARRFQKVLAANRGEIAIRIFRACYDLGLNTVAMYSKEDTLSLFRTKADEAYLIGEKNSPLGAYLDIGEIIDLAKRRGVDAIHPGYGFLSENADFVRACEEAGIAFIGPKSDTMARMGDKLAAKQIAIGCGVPIVPGCTEPLRDGAIADTDHPTKQDAPAKSARKKSPGETAVTSSSPTRWRHCRSWPPTTGANWA